MLHILDGQSLPSLPGHRDSGVTVSLAAHLVTAIFLLMAIGAGRSAPATVRHPESRTLSLDHLKAVQKRRDWPTRVTQRLQLTIQKQLIARALAAEADFTPPPFVRALRAFPWLSRIPARLIGMGVRPEHVRTSEAVPGRARRDTTG